MTLNLFPAPRTLSLKKSRLDLTRASWIVLPKGCSRRLRERVLESAATIGKVLNRQIRVASAAPQSGDLLLEIRLGAKRRPEQGFALTLSDSKRVLVAGGEAGAFYGVQAVTQLIEQFGSTPPALTLSDAPDFPARGVMLDVSRCKVLTMETCKQLVDRFAGMRLNQVQLYIEHTFAFSAHQAVWHDATPFTHEEILELDQYCADRFVELVPNFNSFGHFGRWLRHPEYRHLAECPEKPGTDCLAPNQASIKFLEGLYDEYLPNFSSSTLNVGCDETWELGQGRSKARVAKSSTTAVYLDFIKKIHELCAKKGRRMQFWGDIILHQPELIKELPQDILALNWGYDDDHPYEKECRAFAEAGIEFHVCPGTSAWNSITGRTDNCLANLENAARNGLKYGATGYLITDWGDGGHHQTLPTSYVGFAAGAAYSWNLKSNKTVDLAGAISRHFFQDPTGTLGQFCLDLGRTLNRLPGLKRHNCSAIGQLMGRGLATGRLDISKLTRAQYDRAEAWLDKLGAALTDARPACSDAPLVMREVTHALTMSRHAINRGRYASFGEGSPEALRHELQQVIMVHEAQWLARNRCGGLHESSAILRKRAEIFE
ncbi:MAG: family 20 glycosylhydrolase [Verrucomicrobia bacterium]|jgi:hexosaminidase|nr:family 20 glycosylhydrolase [Verrucomicrobiota bacterium]MBT7065293.1 family 20 glycosylhydrolase [Verrucomicrobiota bacterium]MBT7698753.1 family 20 glycosylhydrolase [Verrucomicrobiota bacterium]